jgi:hypothetical protein
MSKPRNVAGIIVFCNGNVDPSIERPVDFKKPWRQL